MVHDSLTSSSDIAREIKRLLHSNSGEGSSGRRASRKSRSPIDAASLDELRRIFAKLMASNDLTSHQASSSQHELAQQKWKRWLRKQHDLFLGALIDAVRHGRRSALRTFIGVIASSPDGNEHTPPRCFISQRLVILLLQALISPFSTDEDDYDEDVDGLKDSDEIELEQGDTCWKDIHRFNGTIGMLEDGMLQLLEQEFLLPFCDARYFTLAAIRHIAHLLHRQQQDWMKLNKNPGDSTRLQQHITIKLENLVHILIKIPASTKQSSLEPAINKQGLCSNYLFTPQLVTGDENTSLDHESWKQEHEEEEQDMERSGKQDDSSSDSEDGAQPDQSTPTLTKKVPKPACQTLSQHKLALQQAYLAVLKSPNLRPRVLQSILIHLPSHVLPNISSPLRFADFCTRAYEAGGMTSILALQSLFFLMMDHGLEYPNFYSSLYKLIEPSVFYAKYRTRFFQLVTKCIYSNPILPAYVVAAFMKRMCRCALSAPPTGALYVIALVSNLLRKHPECACLIHRGGVDGRVENMLDPFDDQAQDPQASRAIESSLWELQALEKHYYHAIGTMAKACGTEGEDTLIYDMDQFVQHTYKSLFDQEKSRVGKRSAPLAFVEPQKLFKKGDVFDGIFNFPR